MNRGKLFIISGQSGVGKNTILEQLQHRHPEFHRAITCTTRKPRPKEIDGKDHYFFDKQKFNKMIDKGEFIECAKVHSQMYGTPKSQIEDALAAGKNIIMEIDVQGATQIKKLLPDTILIFLKYEEGDLEKTIRNRVNNDPKRGDTPEEEIECRIASARKEAEYEKFYDFSVVNPEGHPEKAVEEIEKIIIDRPQPTSYPVPGTG